MRAQPAAAHTATHDDAPVSGIHPMVAQICAFARASFRVEIAEILIVETAQPALSTLAAAICAKAMALREIVVHTEGAAGFLAAAPLCSSIGKVIGVLYLQDAVARTLAEGGKRQLQHLADFAASAIEGRQENAGFRRRETLLEQACRLASVGSWEVDLLTGERTWSTEMYEIYGVPIATSPLSTAEIMACIVREEDRAWLHALLSPSAESRPSREIREIEIAPRNGGRRWIKAVCSFEQQGGVVTRVFGCNQDVSALHESQLEIERLAYSDPLTSLPNRAFFNQKFQEEIDRAIRQRSKVGIILIDLDHFKDVNDTYGHDAGDALLRAVAERLLRAYRQTDTVARLGGDEFAVILTDVRDYGDLEFPTLRLMEMLRRPVQHGDVAFTISASVGGAIFPADDSGSDSLLKNADIALYQAKAAGRNRFVSYSPNMREIVEARTETLRDVRRGIRQNEFALYYQPVVEIAPERVVGFEALMRWRHPQKGVLTPDTFMPAFEDQELSPLLGEFCLEQALMDMRAWLDAGIDFGRVAINISADQFRRPHLAENIENALARWRISPDRLTIEVTENVYMGWGSDMVGATIRRLHETGVLIALDDFGTGYASLANLKQFPIDRLKVDKSFVQNQSDRPIVEAVITLGARLGMSVIAEGVEDEEQLGFLAANGCAQVQGFHYARPMPFQDVSDFLHRFAAERVAG